jgi:hypothetical protein
MNGLVKMGNPSKLLGVCVLAMDWTTNVKKDWAMRPGNNLLVVTLASQKRISCETRPSKSETLCVSRLFGFKLRNKLGPTMHALSEYLNVQ